MAEKKKGYSSETRDVLSKIPGSGIMHGNKPRDSFTKTDPVKASQKGTQTAAPRTETAKKMDEDLNGKKKQEKKSGNKPATIAKSAPAKKPAAKKPAFSAKEDAEMRQLSSKAKATAGANKSSNEKFNKAKSTGTFANAMKSAKTAAKKTFVWEGRTYSTKKK